MKISDKAGQVFNLIPVGSYDRRNWATRYAQWVNDEEITQFLYQGTIPTSIDKCLNLYDQLTNNNHVVYNIKNGDFIFGIVGIFDIYWPSRVGEFRILLGHRSYWGRGVGKAALEAMIPIAFDRLGLHKFWLGFNGSHKRAEGAYTKSGFKYECTLKKHHFKNGVYNDLHRYCMFQEDYLEWKNSKPD